MGGACSTQGEINTTSWLENLKVRDPSEGVGIDLSKIG